MCALKRIDGVGWILECEIGRFRDLVFKARKKERREPGSFVIIILGFRAK